MFNINPWRGKEKKKYAKRCERGQRACACPTVSKGSDYRGEQKEVVVLSVIIGEETEVVGGQSLSDLEASVCSNSDGQAENRGEWGCGGGGGGWGGVSKPLSLLPPLGTPGP